MMVRTQIQLTEEQACKLKELAARRGVSMAELVRAAVEQALEQDELDRKWRRATAALGRFHGGPSDVSVNHDKYLAEDYL